MSYTTTPLIHPYIDLIQKEYISYGIKEMIPFKPSNRMLDRLFNHFYVKEQCDNWYDNYQEDPRICTWQDPLAEGIWDMSQCTVDTIAKRLMKQYKSKPNQKRTRFFYAWDSKTETLHILWFGRDLGAHYDTWWAMKKRRDKRAKL